MNDTAPHSQATVKRTIIRFGTASAVLLSAEGLFFGKMVLQKTLTALVMPCGLIWYLLSFTVLLGLASRNRLLTIVTAVTWIFYTVMSNGFVSHWAAQQIESAFVNISPLDEQPFDYVVLLGGGARTGVNGRHQGNSSGDRIVLTAQMYHANLAPKIIVTGTRIDALAEIDPAEQSRQVLLELGVPPDVIESIAGQNTSQEMASLGERFAGSESRLGLVTSAWHLRRTMRLAAKNGLHVHPLPADFMTGIESPWTLAQKLNACIPQAESLVNNTRIAKEYLGSFVGR